MYICKCNVGKCWHMLANVGKCWQMVVANGGKWEKAKSGSFCPGRNH